MSAISDWSRARHQAQARIRRDRPRSLADGPELSAARGVATSVVVGVALWTLIGLGLWALF